MRNIRAPNTPPMPESPPSPAHPGPEPSNRFRSFSPPMNENIGSGPSRYRGASNIDEGPVNQMPPSSADFMPTNCMGNFSTASFAGLKVKPTREHIVNFVKSQLGQMEKSDSTQSFYATSILKNPTLFNSMVNMFESTVAATFGTAVSSNEPKNSRPSIPPPGNRMDKEPPAPPSRGGALLPNPPGLPRMNPSIPDHSQPDYDRNMPSSSFYNQPPSGQSAQMGANQMLKDLSATLSSNPGANQMMMAMMTMMNTMDPKRQPLAPAQQQKPPINQPPIQDSNFPPVSYNNRPGLLGQVPNEFPPSRSFGQSQQSGEAPRKRRYN